MPYPGGCHCGALNYVYWTGLGPHEWPIRACQCSFCRAHGARSTADPQGSVVFRVQQPLRLQRYRFGHRLADFLICSLCGVYVGAVTEVSGSLFAVINVNTLRPCPPGLKAPTPVHYDDESAERRSARRRSRWTPCAGIDGLSPG